MKLLFHCLPLIFLLASCTAKTQPLNYGTDGCSFCKMSIVDKKFGAELITKKGKVYKFDSAECMIRFVKSGNVVKQADVASYWVVNAADEGKLIDATTAIFLHSLQFPSPMGAFISAFANNTQLNTFKAQYPGDVWTWDQTYTAVK